MSAWAAFGIGVLVGGTMGTLAAALAAAAGRADSVVVRHRLEVMDGGADEIGEHLARHAEMQDIRVIRP